MGFSTGKKLLVTKRNMRSGSGALSTWGTNLLTSKTVNYSRDRRDVTALATQVNKCTAVMWTVNFNITGNGKMMKNGLYLFKFSDFFTSLRLFWRKNIVFCPAELFIFFNWTDFLQIIEKTRVGVGWTAIGLRSFRRERN